MGKIFIRVLGVLLLLVAGLLGVAAMQPSEFSVTRSATMAASQEQVFANVNDFHNWEAWSPWAKLDPNCKNTFEGPATGNGAMFSWDGNNEIGAGKMTILESLPSEKIKVKLDFIRPMASTCDVEFTFKPDAEKTAVTWTMSGHNNLIGKVFCLFMNMDRKVGGDFEKGLTSLKGIVEAK